MKADLLIFFAVCVAVAGSFDCSEINSKHSDGCQAKGFGIFREVDYTPPFWAEDFKPACDGLDVCYDCGASLRHNFSIIDCDKKFWNHMGEICYAQRWWWWLPCQISRVAYSAGVMSFGMLRYITNPTEVGDLCHQPNAAQCMRG